MQAQRKTSQVRKRWQPLYFCRSCYGAPAQDKGRTGYTFWGGNRHVNKRFVPINTMKVLDLFSGTGSVARVFRRLGHDVTTLDRDMEADIKTDITDWDYL